MRLSTYKLWVWQLKLAPGRRLGAQTVLTTKLDVSRAEDVQAWVKHAHDTFGRLDGAANVAGIAAGTGETVIETIVRQLIIFCENASLI